MLLYVYIFFFFKSRTLRVRSLVRSKLRLGTTAVQWKTETPSRSLEASAAHTHYCGRKRIKKTFSVQQNARRRMKNHARSSSRFQSLRDGRATHE